MTCTYRPGLMVVVAAALLLSQSVALSGTPDLKSYPSSELRDGSYHKAVHQKVGSAWQRPAQTPREGSKAVVIATILRDGSLMDARLNMKSGSDEWDKAAVDAVKRAAPFGPLPKSYARTSLEVHFHFEYN
ncbi:MAG: energy transducer TonB [Candidatus Polarisedimenticolia bacterium]